MPEGIITRWLCIKVQQRFEFGVFELKNKELSGLSRSGITDKTSLRAMSLLNH